MTGITVYLAKQGVEYPDQLLRRIDELRYEILAVDEEIIGELFILQRRPQIPSWASFFSESNIDQLSLGSTQSAGAILIVEVDGRLAAVTFGSSHHYLRSEQLEDRFGLLVAVNSIEEHRLRSIDKDTFDAIAKKSRQQSIREAETREFGLDIEQDLLRGVTGTPTDKRLGVRLTGKESLRAIGSFNLKLLHGQLQLYLQRFCDTVYREQFPWIDNIRDVKSMEAKEKLDRILHEKLASGKREDMWLAAPDIIDWERTAGFSYRFGRDRPVIYDMHLDSAVEQFSGMPLTIERLRQKYVQALSLDDVEVARWPLYRCLHAEIEYEGNVYLLSNGRWFRADIDFVARVDAATASIPLIDLGLPPFDVDDKVEGDYNARVARTIPDRFFGLHGKLIQYGGGRSSIEPCDLYSSSHDFIHVKRYSGSSDLSHLFAQGVIAGETFARDRAFRDAVSDALPAPFRSPRVSNALPRNRFRIVFAVISRSGSKLRLPFFARLNLKRAQEILVSLGYSVALADISVDDRRRLMKRAKRTKRVF